MLTAQTACTHTRVKAYLVAAIAQRGAEIGQRGVVTRPQVVVTTRLAVVRGSVGAVDPLPAAAETLRAGVLVVLEVVGTQSRLAAMPRGAVVGHRLLRGVVDLQSHTCTLFQQTKSTSWDGQTRGKYIARQGASRLRQGSLQAALLWRVLRVCTSNNAAQPPCHTSHKLCECDRPAGLRCCPPEMCHARVA